MAGAEKLIEKILGDAQRDAEATWADAEAKKQALREKALRDMDRRKSEIERMADNSIAENKKRMAAVYDLEYRKQLLSAKQEMMHKVRAMTLEKLRSLDDTAFLKLMKQRLLSCATSGTGAIAVAPGEVRLDAVFLADVNAALKKTTGRGELTLLSERRNIADGFVYVNGGMEIDVSLEALLSEAWQQTETQVASALFEQYVNEIKHV
jgi:V/A-type H+-transporting ATPase subunit E